MKFLGYIVIEACEDYEQPLGLNCSQGLPTGGVLVWVEGARTVFSSRIEAKKAIDRTEHYRLAYGIQHPEKKFCKIVPLTAAQ